MDRCYYTLEAQYHRTSPFVASLYIVAMKEGILIVCPALAYVSLSGTMNSSPIVFDY